MSYSASQIGPSISYWCCRPDALKGAIGHHSIMFQSDFDVHKRKYEIIHKVRSTDIQTYRQIDTDRQTTRKQGAKHD
jgi:hypothetical protein